MAGAIRSLASASLPLPCPLPVDTLPQFAICSSFSIFTCHAPTDYGAFPQTWEVSAFTRPIDHARPLFSPDSQAPFMGPTFPQDPAHVTAETGCCGDNDPLDVFDIGNRRWAVGAIVRVKVLGVIGLIDAGETDWKVVAISAEDPLAPLLNDLDDIEVQIPGALESLISWLRFYKSPVINTFAFDGRPQGRAYAERIIEETHVAWRGLVERTGGSDGPSTVSAGLRRSTSASKLALPYS